MRIKVVKHVRSPLAKVYGWCTDYQETDPALSPVAIRARKVLSRSADEVELEDDGVLGMSGAVHYRIRLHPPNGWEADATSRMGTGHNEYRLTAEEGGTRIAVTFALRPRGGYRIIGFFARPFLARRLSRLWEDFVADLEKER